MMEMMQRRDWPGNIVSLSGTQQEGTSVSAQLMATHIRLAGKRTIMANYTRYTDEMIADASQPYAAHPAAPAMPSDPINQLLLPVFAGVQVNEVNAETQKRAPPDRTRPARLQAGSRRVPTRAPRPRAAVSPGRPD